MGIHSTLDCSIPHADLVFTLFGTNIFYSLHPVIPIAITYECIRTVTTIYPRPDLIKKAADSVARFLTAANNNWKYLGECGRVGECDGDVDDSVMVMFVIVEVCDGDICDLVKV